nr:cholinesterase 1-like isoform X2 [Rhipicephalus microplus]
MSHWRTVTVAALTSLLCGAERPVVRTSYGPVEGVRLSHQGKHVDGFFGIPFAQPPVGELRFRKPLPAKPWKNVRDASQFKPACMQTNHRLNREVLLNYTTSSSEDCLHINVWRPSCVTENACDYQAPLLPVVLFIYGGAFQWGDASAFYNDGLAFASVNEVVFVNFNYRMNVFGFLSDWSPDAPGNLAFWDQLLAMQWVRRSISAFGGDPLLVTLYGQSSGSMSAGVHVLSPLSKGLFKRCIFESGTALSLITFQRRNQMSFFTNFAGQLNCTDRASNTSAMLECMRKVNPREVIHRLGTVGQLTSMFFPISGDVFVPEYPIDFDNVDCINGEEMLMGTTLDEGTVFFYHPIERLRNLEPALYDYYEGATAIVLSTSFSIPLSTARQYISSLFDNSTNDLSVDEVLRTLSHSFGDPVFVCSTNLWGEQLAKRGHSIYRYVYSQRMPLSVWDEWMGVVHTDDLPYMLGSVATFKANLRSQRWNYLPDWFRNYNVTSAELTFSTNLVKSLGAFVKTGRPKIPLSDAEWPKYTAENPEFVYLQPSNYTRGFGPKKERCEYWRPFLLKQSKGASAEQSSLQSDTSSTGSPQPAKSTRSVAPEAAPKSDVRLELYSSSYTLEPSTVLFTLFAFIIWICMG